MLDGSIISKKLSAKDLTLGENHSVLIGNKEYGLVLYQSGNVATMYIDTATGTMDEVYKDIDHKEPVSISVFDENGGLDFTSDDCVLKGRGNSTWGKEKRPFNIQLESAAEILGMKKAENWVLLANANDVTNLRDKIVKDLSGKLGFLYSPDEKYVDLYINGEYNGLYLISEKVEVGENRLNISENSVLCSFEFVDRWKVLDNPFTTDAGQTIEVKYPYECSDNDLKEIEAYIQQMENAILDENGIEEINSKPLEEIIDIDSWVRMYLIDEIFEDVDAGIASSYFYWSWEDGKIYRGPVWDYDNTLGNGIYISNTQTFWANKVWRLSGGVERYLPYYNALLQNELFKERVIEIYNAEFVPLIDDLIDNDIEQLGVSIAEASAMNFVRWSELFTSILQEKEISKYTTADGLREYLRDRKSFLNEALSYISDYCMVYVGQNYLVSVKSGDLADIPDAQTLGIENFVCWVDDETGEEFDFTQPITHDVKIVAKVRGNAFINKILRTKTYLFCAVSLFVFLITMCSFILIDIKRSGKVGRADT